MFNEWTGQAQCFSGDFFALYLYQLSNYPPSFHSVVSTHNFPRVNSDVCFRSLREKTAKNCYLVVREGWQH